MVNEGMAFREAAEEWVKSFNAIPTSMVAKLWSVEPEDWSEVTLPEVGESVYTYSYGAGGINGVDYESNRYTIELNSDRTVEVEASQMEVERDSHLPMWGTMWSFEDSLDVDWQRTTKVWHQYHVVDFVSTKVKNLAISLVLT